MGLEKLSGSEQRERFMDAACSRLGFCLPRKVKDTLRERSDLAPKDFVGAVIAAEGIDPVHLESHECFKPLLNLFHQHVSDS